MTPNTNETIINISEPLSRHAGIIYTTHELRCFHCAHYHRVTTSAEFYSAAFRNTLRELGWEIDPQTLAWSCPAHDHEVSS
jgi:hypothetical protein